MRKVSGTPGLAQSRRAEIPVRADLTRHYAQVMPKIDDGGAAPEPIAIIDTVDHETRLQHQRVRDHRIVLGIGVLLDVEVLLDGSRRVGKERPLGTD